MAGRASVRELEADHNRRYRRHEAEQPEPGPADRLPQRVRRLATALGALALLTAVTGGAAVTPEQDDTEAVAPLPVGTDGFQTQESEQDFWAERMGLVLHHNGEPVVDEAWGEWLLDLRTPAQRDRLAVIMGRWIRGCADDGFDAVEFDNLDSFTRSGGLLDRADAVAFARLLVATAHEAGLAAGQKNLAQFDGTTVGYDFAVAEECGRYRECGEYVDHYGDQVLVIEYRARDFERTCTHHGASLAVVLRDRGLSSDGRRRWC